MRRCLAVFCLLAILVPPVVSLAATQVAYVHTPDAAAFRRLAAYPVSIEESELPDWTRLAATPETIRELQKSGYEVEVIIDDLAAWAAARLSPPDPTNALPPDNRVALDHYLTYEEAAVFLQDEQAAYPDILSVETIGQSVLGRDLWLVKISDNVAENEAEPAVIFDHCIHGDELAGCMLGFFIIQWLTEGYGVDPEVTALVDEREIFIVPTVNPDGNQPDDYSRYNANG
ncbi:MAG: hypothetical protein GX444_00155, partial [Myxococcales bacterium]|nr:hypothetical protein [Myxococcales bacterium]